MGQNAGGLAGAFHGADDVQQIGVIPLFGRRLAPFETVVGIGCRGQACTPCLVGKGRIGHNIVISAQIFAVRELGGGREVHRSFARVRRKVGIS